MRRLPSACAVLFVLAASSTAVPVRADQPGPSSGKNAAAEELFAQGRALLDAGRFGEACAKLAESERLDPAAGTLLNLADCFEKNGQTASAWATFKDAERAAAARQRPDWERLAGKRAKALEPKLSRITLTVPDAARVSGLAVSLNAVHVEAAAFDTAIPVDPGAVVVSASAPGRQPWAAQVDVRADGDKVAITIPALAVEPSTPRIAPATPSASGRLPALSWGLGAAAVVLGAAGATSWVIGRNEKSDLEDGCGRTASCGHGDVVASRTKLILGDVLMGSGAIALGAAIVVALTASTSVARRSTAWRVIEGRF